MKKSPLLLLIFLCATLVTEASDNACRNVFFHAENLGFFDNREVQSPYQHSGTYFGTRLGLEGGIRRDNSSLMAGGWLVKDFGQQGLSDKGLTLCYAYKGEHWSGVFGSFPRRMLLRELPDVFVDEAVRYYTPNLNGALLQHRGQRGAVELYCDWLNRQSYTEREIFEIVSDGDLRLNDGDARFALGYNARLTHFSVRKGKTPDKVYDKLMLNPFGSFQLQANVIDSLTVTAGPILSLNRDRNDKIWKAPVGFLGDLRLDVGRFNLRNRLYAGKPLMSDYELYGEQLHRGDPWYRSAFYNRTDLSFYLLRNSYADCRVTASFHFTEKTMDNSQQIILRVLF